MKIERIVTTLIALPLRRPHRLAMATITDQAMVIVQLFTDEGCVGVGEVSVIPNYGAETPGAIRHVIEDYLAPRLVGEDPCNTMFFHADPKRIWPGCILIWFGSCAEPWSSPKSTS